MNLNLNKLFTIWRMEFSKLIFLLVEYLDALLRTGFYFWMFSQIGKLSHAIISFSCLPKVIALAVVTDLRSSATLKINGSCSACSQLITTLFNSVFIDRLFCALNFLTALIISIAMSPASSALSSIKSLLNSGHLLICMLLIFSFCLKYD